MKANQIKVGGLYRAKVSNQIVTVRVDAIEDCPYPAVGRAYTAYHVTNLSTGRKTTFRSAIKFRCEVEGKKRQDPTLAGSAVQDSAGRPAVAPSSPSSAVGSDEGKKRSDPIGGGQSPSATPPSPSPASRPASTVLSGTGTSAAAGATPASGRPSIKLADRLATRQQSLDSDKTPHLEVQALAGTGKTTTVVEGLIAAKGRTPRVKPSPQQAEVWKQLAAGRHDTVRLSAFNTTITDELKTRVNATGLDRMGVEARGVHSLGLQAVTKAFGRVQATKWAVIDHVCECLGQRFENLKTEKGMLTLVNAVDDLVSLCKQTLTEPTPDALDQLSSRYDIELGNGGSERTRIYDLVPQVLERCKTPKGKISFDDMIWLPLVLDLSIPKVDVQIIDESQDLNRMQQELIYRAGHRIVFVGDRHQAIYGFAGADAESMKRMAEVLGSQGRGCTTLPLTVTRRCGKAIVAEAQQYVHEFEAHADNAEGIVRRMKFSRKGKSASYWTQGEGGSTLRQWEETYGPAAEDGCLVLCRVNAPLVSECMRFLKRRIKANILGKKVGSGLISLIEKSKASTVPELIGWLEAWLEREQAAENAKKFPSETKLENLQDRVDCIAAFTEDCTYAHEVIRKIGEVFVDDTEKRGVRFSSIHKSKGLEARQVFILQAEGCTGPNPDKLQSWEVEQEDNLRYVAITRAIEELVYVS